MQGLDAPCEFCTNNKLLDKNGKPNKPYVWEFQNTITKQWYQCSDQAIKWTDGRFVRLEIATDITDRKKAELIIHNQNQEYEALNEELRITNKELYIGKNQIKKINSQLIATINALPDLMFETDSKGRIINYHAPQPNILYTTPEIFIGKKIEEVLPPDSAKICNNAITQAIKNGKHTGAVYSLQLPQGLYWFELSIAAKGENKSVIMLIRDITERKKAEQALKTSEEKYKNIFETAPVGIATFDINGDVLNANKSLLKILGSPSIEASRKINILKSNSIENSSFSQDFRNCVANKQAIKNENIYTTFWGKEIYVHYYLTPILDNHNNIQCVQCIFEDFTKRKEMENTLRKQNKQLVVAKEKYRLLTETMKDVVVKISTTGELLYISPSVEQFGGYLPNEEIGQHISRYFADKTDLQNALNLITEVIETPKSGSFEFIFQPKNKAPFSVEHTYIPLIKDNKVYAIQMVLRDITERKKAEQALIESDERFRTVADFAYDWEYWISPQNEFIYISPSCERITGYSLSEFKQNPELLISIIHPDDVDNWKNHKHNASGKAEIETIEFRIITKNGEERWIGHVCQTVLKNGINIGIRGSNRDITERKKIEEALQKSEDRLSKTLIAANDGMWDWNLITNEVYFDPRYYEMAGYAVDEFPYELEEFQKRIQPDDIENVMLCEQQHIEGKVARFNVEFRFKKKDNSWLWVLGRGKIVERDKDNKPTRFIGTHIDITERKEVEQSLRESEKDLKAIFENKGTATGIFGKDRIIKTCNTRFVELSGYSKQEVEGKMLWTELIAKEDLKRLHEYDLQRTKNIGNPPLQYECQIIKKNGEQLYCTLNIGMNGDDRIVSLTDINDRKKAEQALKESNKTKDKFFSIIAHDLKSPFNSMLGFARILENDLDKYDTEQRKQFISIIHKGLKDTFNLLENLLYWSRSQRGVITFNPETINLYILLQNTSELLMLSAKNKSIKIKNKIPEHISVEADQAMLSIIIRNLISNAIKFTPDGGEIIITAQQTKANSKFVEISVKDTGVGISNEIQPMLFDIGENTSTKGTKDETGTGLGLILCKEFIEKHSGEIWVESEIGKGSSFSFTIPIVN